MGVPSHSGHGCGSATLNSHSTQPDPQSSFQRALCPLLVLGQCFALMPVSGLTGHDASTLRFRWRSPRVVYTCLSLSGILCQLYFCVRELSTGNRIAYTACGEWSSAWVCSLLYANELMPISRAILEKLRAAQLVRNFTPFVEPGGPRQCSQKTVTGHYPEPDKSTPYFPIQFILRCVISGLPPLCEICALQCCYTAWIGS
jgi:hypothetical protein